MAHLYTIDRQWQAHATTDRSTAYGTAHPYYAELTLSKNGGAKIWAEDNMCPYGRFVFSLPWNGMEKDAQPSPEDMIKALIAAMRAMCE